MTVLALPRPALLGALLAAVSIGRGTAQDVAAVVAGAEACGLRVAVALRDVDASRSVYDHRSGAAQLPASNQKLLTAVAFLDALGTDYRFRTGFRLLEGRLVARAGGDPNWMRGGPVDPTAAFAQVAAALRAAGNGAVRGVDVDLGAFGGPSRPDGWPSGQLQRHYCAPTGGVVLEQGCFLCAVGPGDQEAIVRVLSPLAGIGISGRITLTDDRAEGGRYHLEMKDGEVKVRGRLWRRASMRDDVRVAVDEPVELFRRALERGLIDGGIRVDPAAPAGTADVSTIESPLAPVLTRMLQDSINFDAEQLLRVLGAEIVGDGSFAGGARAVRAKLAEHFEELPDELRVADGSGLSRGNRVTAGFLAELLQFAARAPWATAFVGALPRAGEDGTMQRRFRDSALSGRVRAKTGSLSNTSALSGYLQARSGRLLAFSILMEWDRSLQGVDPHEWQEKIVAAFDAGA